MPRLHRADVAGEACHRSHKRDFHRLDDVDLQHLHHFQLEAADAILHGANPGEIPFYQVSKFELSINLKTAKAARAYGTVHLACHSRQSGGVGYPRFKRSKHWHRLKGRYGPNCDVSLGAGPWPRLHCSESRPEFNGSGLIHHRHSPQLGRMIMTKESIALSKHVPWNKGKLTGAKPPLRPKHVWAIRTKLQVEGRLRDLAMFNLAIDSKLRGCDIVALKVEDVAPNGYAFDRATVRQKKTGRSVRFELTEPSRQAIDDYLRQVTKKPGEFLFSDRRGPARTMTIRQYSRLVSRWIASTGLDASLFGTHSLRRTKATLIYRRTGNLRAVQLLLGHTKIESTVRYLGIEVDDALAIAEQVDV